MPDPVVTPDPNTPAETPTITLETVTAKTPDQLDDNDKQWLESNAETLDDEVADKYGIIKPITEVTPVVRGAQLPAEQG